MRGSYSFHLFLQSQLPLHQLLKHFNEYFSISTILIISLKYTLFSELIWIISYNDLQIPLLHASMQILQIKCIYRNLKIWKALQLKRIAPKIWAKYINFPFTIDWRHQFSFYHRLNASISHLPLTTGINFSCRLTEGINFWFWQKVFHWLMPYNIQVFIFLVEGK